MAETTPKAKEPSSAEGTSTPPSGGRTASEFKQLADDLRKRTDLFGKTLAAIATLGTTAVGLSKIGDLFPAEDNEGWAVAACVGLAVAALMAIAVAVRLMNVARPVFIDADLDNNKDLDDKEREKVRPLFADTAGRFGYTSLRGLQERERSLRNAAAQAIDKDERARRTGLADEVKTEIEGALARSQVVVVRRRSTRAVSDFGAWVLYILVIAGLLAFAAGTDKVASDRKDMIAEAKSCADARKAGATKEELKRTKICTNRAQESEKTPETPPSAATAYAQIVTKLAATLDACAALVHKPGDNKSGPLKDADCKTVRKAFSELDPP